MTDRPRYTPVENEVDAGDLVGCLNCYWQGLVDRGGDVCPKCGHEGMVWQRKAAR